MSIRQKAITIAMIGTVAASSLATTPALAVASELSPQETEIFMLAEDEQPGTTVLRERGRCTDSYSKEWCDTHGFKNNRPVPHKVQLNQKEKDCLFKFWIDGTGAILKDGVEKQGNMFIGVARAVYELYICLK